MKTTEMLQALINHCAAGKKKDFAEKVGISPQGLSSWLKRGDFQPELIYDAFDDISASWLLSQGKGKMVVDKSIQESNGQVYSRYLDDLRTLQGLLHLSLANVERMIAEFQDSEDNSRTR